MLYLSSPIFYCLYFILSRHPISSLYVANVYVKLCDKHFVHLQHSVDDAIVTKVMKRHLICNEVKVKCELHLVRFLNRYFRLIEEFWDDYYWYTLLLFMIEY